MGYPDYYKVLDVSEHATLEEIKLAYKRQALVHHPDRLDPGASAAERAEATKRFQLIADAYYVLSDENRRKEYDHVRDRHGDPAKARPQATETEAHNVFGNVFEELLQPEVERPGHLWRILGGGSGAVLGFIVGNLGGAAVGAVMGSTLGRIRDNKGVSVYTAFNRLAADQRRDILTALLTRFMMAGSAGVMK